MQMDAIHYHVRSEGFNRQLRKVTKSRTVFPSDDSLLKMLYLATMDITKKWTGRRRDWSQIRAQLEIYFEERLEKAEFEGNLFDMSIYTCIMQIEQRTKIWSLLLV